MNEITYNKTYTEFKYEVGTELSKASESFVKIGYLLKVARDTNVLQSTPYENNYLKFAEEEFGLEKTQVSRFIRINDRFSVDGNSMELVDKYKGFGTRKLGIMLTLPEEITEELTPEFTVDEITEIQQTVKEEQNVTPIESYAEKVEAEQSGDVAAVQKSLIDTVMLQILKEHPQEFADILREPTRAYKILSPVDNYMYRVRVAGMGNVLVTFHEDKITVFNARTDEKETFFKTSVESSIDNIRLDAVGLDPATAYEKIFGQEFPKEEPKEEPKKEEPKKEKKEKRLDSGKPKKKKLAAEKVPSDEQPREEAEDSGDAEEHREEPSDIQEPAGTSEASLSQDDGTESRTEPALNPDSLYNEALNLYRENRNKILDRIDKRDFSEALRLAKEDAERLSQFISNLEKMQNWREIE